MLKSYFEIIQNYYLKTYNKNEIINHYHLLYDVLRDMGWYRTCRHCNETKKYGHFECGCIEKYQATLTEKVNNSEFIESHIYRTFPYEWEFKKYSKNGEIFYTKTCTENDSGDFYIFDDYCECTQEEFDKQESEEDDEDDESSEYSLTDEDYANYYNSCSRNPLSILSDFREGVYDYLDDPK